VRQKRWIAAIALTGLAVLGTGVVDVVTSSGGSARYPVAWDPKVLPIVHFVERERGLTFKHPVPVAFLSDADFDKQVAVPAAESKKDKADLERALGTLRALGLVRGKVDLAAELDRLHKASIIGIYLPEKKAVFVRGTHLDPYGRATLAHELTHVLQDQYFDLAKLHKDAPGGDTTAVTSLIEGDAVRIQDAYEQNLSAADEKAFAAAQRLAAARAGGAANVPAVLGDFLSFPYVFGPVLLDSLTQEDGNAAVDRAFRQPPSAEAQVLDPVGHPADEKPVVVPPPALPAGATKLDDIAPFGQVSLFEVLGSQLGYRSAWDAVARWTGDASVPYKARGASCVAIDVAMVDDAATRLLDTTLRQWALHVPGAVIGTSKGLVTVRSCDPGVRGRALPRTSPSAFTVLAARAQLIHQAMSRGYGYPAGRCLADGVIAGLGPSGYGDLVAAAPSAAQVAVLGRLIRESLARCQTGHG
jgi:hypothetical protein